MALTCVGAESGESIAMLPEPESKDHEVETLATIISLPDHPSRGQHVRIGLCLCGMSVLSTNFKASRQRQ